ncbi:MAG: ParB/RepB/Spo0J family partition protein [Burkholderiaceae bacterium]
MNSVVQNLKLEQIRTNGDTQSRVEINNETVAEYAEALTEGEKFPPVIVFFDGADYWLADGFHRRHAHKKIGALDIQADVRDGTQLDARIFSHGANRDHGLRRTNADKKKAVLGMLRDAPDWSDNKIAKHVGVHHSTVGDYRRSLAESASEGEEKRTYTTKHGTEAVMNTTGIGKKKSEPAQQGTLAEPQTAANDEPERSGPDEAELAANEAAERADREALAKLLDSDDALATAHAEIKRLNFLAAGLEQRVNGLLNEKNEVIRLLKKEKNRADRLQKQLDAKVAA